MSDTATDHAIDAGVQRLVQTYPPQKWTDGLMREYRRILGQLDDPELIRRCIDAAIDGNESRFAPPPGVLVSIGAELVRERRGYVPPKPELTVDEAALVDALAARDAAEQGRTDLWTVAEAEAWIASIRRRLELERVEG